MIIATVSQNGHNYPVEVVDIFTTGDGRKLAAVRALQGQPFTRWTMGGPCNDDTANVRLDCLTDVHPSNPPARLTKPNLLDLALEYRNRGQWYSGESVHLITTPQGKPKAWLKNEGGRVLLFAAGIQAGLLVYLLYPDGWHVSHDVTSNYKQWAASAQR